MGSGGVAIAALPTVICLKVPFSDGLGGGASQEIICNSGRQQTKSLTKIPNQNALEFLASGKDFVMDRLTGSKSK